MPFFRDQLGNEIFLNVVPRRIISLVPSQSEFLWDLGIRPAGITKFCVHPSKMFLTCERVGGTKTLDIEKIRMIRPDLIIGNKEENEIRQIQTLQKEFPVWMSDIVTLDDALNMMHQIAELTGLSEPGKYLLDEIKVSVSAAGNLFTPIKTLYFMWHEPYMVAAQNTFIHSVLSHAGLQNAATHLQRYPELDEKHLQNLDPDLCLLSSEPFPFKEKHVADLQKILPRAKIVLVDGEMFSWYGSRLRLLPEYLKSVKSQIK